MWIEITLSTVLYCMSEDEAGINIEYSHERARKLVPEKFFWDCTDEFAPFGSDEGDTALNEFREWRKEKPGSPIKECVNWALEIGGYNLESYNLSLATEENVQQIIDNDEADYLIFTNDITVIATVFGQLADEGTIDLDAKPYAEVALQRILIWMRLDHPDWYEETKPKYEVLHRVLKEA